jgi:protein tyrosine phosphatase (PTP) superfamily phosphohydrolase (DUF442 family)
MSRSPHRPYDGFMNLLRTCLGLMLWAGTLGIAHAQPGLESIVRLHHFTPQLSSAGLPKPEHFAALAAAGYEVVINLVPSGKMGERDERELVEAAGMRYHHVAVDWSHPKVDDVVQAVDLLERYRDRKVLVHCTANARASAVVYLYRTLRLGAPEPEELALMTRIWKQNRGFELENQPQWQFLLDEARDQLHQR